MEFTESVKDSEILDQKSISTENMCMTHECDCPWLGARSGSNVFSPLWLPLLFLHPLCTVLLPW